MNLKKEILTLRGVAMPMSFPTKDDIERIKLEKEIDAVTADDLPVETASNIILNALSVYKVTDMKEGFMVQSIAQWLLDDNRAELSKIMMNFLKDKVLHSAMIRVEEEMVDKEIKKVEKGVYASWAIIQVIDELNAPDEVVKEAKVDNKKEE